MSGSFPTFSRWFDSPGWPLARWTSTPWWPADTLATQQYALLQLLSTAVDERLELAPIVTSLAKEHRGRFRRRLYRLSKRLAAGTLLPDALEQTPGTLSEEQTLAIRFGTQSGTLPEVLRMLIQSHDQSLQSIRYRVRQITFYGTFVGVLFLLVLSFIMIKIIPSFQAILDDFSLDMTTSLKLLVGASNLLVQLGPIILLGMIFCYWLVRTDLPQRFFRRRILSRIFQPVSELRTAGVLRLLAIAQQSGRPLPASLSTLARYHYDSMIRNKLLFARNEVEQGAELWMSFAAVKLISPAESRVLENSIAADSAVWTLQHLADWKCKLVERRLDVYIELLTPSVILLMASNVLLTALATLTPLFEMTTALS